MSAARLLAVLAARGESLAVAESLTGGLLAAELVAVPGASAVFRGGVIAYASELKASLLGVDRALLEERGAVDAEVASAMASGVRRLAGAEWGLATTGVAGPTPQGSRRVGECYIGVAGPSGVWFEALSLGGGRERIRREVVRCALEALERRLRDTSSA